MKYLYSNSIPNPCAKDCPDRKAGCAINCTAWAEYRNKRDLFYQQKLEAKEAEMRTKEALRKQKEALRRQKNR